MLAVIHGVDKLVLKGIKHVDTVLIDRADKNFFDAVL